MASAHKPIEEIYLNGPEGPFKRDECDKNNEELYVNYNEGPVKDFEQIHKMQSQDKNYGNEERNIEVKTDIRRKNSLRIMMFSVFYSLLLIMVLAVVVFTSIIVVKLESKSSEKEESKSFGNEAKLDKLESKILGIEHKVDTLESRELSRSVSRSEESIQHASLSSTKAVRRCVHFETASKSEESSGGDSKDTITVRLEFNGGFYYYFPWAGKKDYGSMFTQCKDVFTKDQNPPLVKINGNSDDGWFARQVSVDGIGRVCLNGTSSKFWVDGDGDASQCGTGGTCCKNNQWCTLSKC